MELTGEINFPGKGTLSILYKTAKECSKECSDQQFNGMRVMGTRSYVHTHSHTHSHFVRLEHLSKGPQLSFGYFFILTCCC